MNTFSVIIIGAGPGGIFAAYELMHNKPDMKVAVFEAGHALNKRHCPIDGDKINAFKTGIDHAVDRVVARAAARLDRNRGTVAHQHRAASTVGDALAQNAADPIGVGVTGQVTEIVAIFN